ncbi:transposase [Candidatus Woesearchaeota archaeon]|nr:transposase [Candidatus Woesearchaeota archaeon]
MQEEIKLSELKTLLILAKNNINSQLKLNKTKDIKYTEDDYLDEISFLSLLNCCAEDGSEAMNIIDDKPCGGALLKQLKKLAFEEVEQQYNELFEKQFYQMLPKAKKGKKYKATLIIDNHEQETYSKEKRSSRAIRGGKHKNGTNFFFKYMTLQVLIKDRLINLAVRFYSREITQAKLIDKLIKYAKNYVKIKVVLLDRGFRDVKIINDLEYRQAPVLMPMVKDKKGEDCFNELGRKNFKAIKYWLKNQKGEYADVKLLMIRLSNGKEIGFYTTLGNTWMHNGNYYLNLYKKRWKIETGYRLQNMFLAKTTSINKVIRYFYFCYAVAMHNLWLIIRLTRKVGQGFTVLKMKFILLLGWVFTHLPKDW